MPSLIQKVGAEDQNQEKRVLKILLINQKIGLVLQNMSNQSLLDDQCMRQSLKNTKRTKIIEKLSIKH